MIEKRKQRPFQSQTSATTHTNLFTFYIFSLFIISAIYSPQCHSENTQDPESHFIKTTKIRKSTTITTIEADLNADKKNDFLITKEAYSGSTSGALWRVYLSEGKKYITDATYVVSLRVDAVHYGYLEEFNKNCLLTFHPSSSSSGSIGAICVKDDSLVRKTIRSLNFSKNPNDKKIYRELFSRGGYDKIYSHDIEPSIDDFFADEQVEMVEPKMGTIYIFGDPSKGQPARLPENIDLEAERKKRESLRTPTGKTVDELIR